MLKNQYELVLLFDCSSLEDYDELIALEDELLETLTEKVAVVCAHEAGSDEMNIILKTNDPQLAFKEILSLIPVHLKLSLKAGFRAFSANTPYYTAIYPSDLTAFEVT